MKPLLLVLLGAVLLVAALLAAARLHAAPTVATDAVRLPPAARAGEMVLYGHIRSLRPKGPAYEMRFDPAFWLTGVTAQRAAVQDKVLRPGEPVPNDYYIVEEGHRLLVYVVPASARVTVLTAGVSATRITVSELASIVAGKNPRHRRLFEPKAGFWIRVGFRYPSPVLSLDQQYQP